MSRQAEKFVVYNLRETYHELGTYEFKIVLSPKFFKNSHFCDVSFVDSDGKAMKADIGKWGRKINCSFVIDSAVADGVARVNFNLRKEEDSEPVPGMLTFWVIKP